MSSRPNKKTNMLMLYSPELKTLSALEKSSRKSPSLHGTRDISFILLKSSEWKGLCLPKTEFQKEKENGILFYIVGLPLRTQPSFLLSSIQDWDGNNPPFTGRHLHVKDEGCRNQEWRRADMEVPSESFHRSSSYNRLTTNQSFLVIDGYNPEVQTPATGKGEDNNIHIRRK